MQSALSDQPLQHTSLDLQCVCDAPQNCPILQNFMYILHKFCTFPVTEGDEILHLHFSLQLQAENSSKIHEKYKFPASPHPKSHKFLRPLNYSSEINPERHEFQANALIETIVYQFLFYLDKIPHQVTLIHSYLNFLQL